ncbi:MAG: bifunctional riboflavin kinase/FAD synthetase [Anaerolineae bacterium]|nr:bifunctional riboflavin kinase/FAD synthetase [Anaerolineae bacterium]
MIVSRELTCCNLPAACIAIGSFDGVHIGHQSLIRQMVDSAHTRGVPAVVVTFYPQPVVLFKNLKSNFYISSLEERRDLIEELGADYLLTLPFTYELAAVSADDFLKMLKEQLGMLELWVGEEFTLGKGREGTVERITQIGAARGFAVHAIERVQLDGEIVSSSRIRDALREGDLLNAERMLGRVFRLEGPVVHGAHRGRTIGFPTANMDIDPLRVKLQEGVYWTRLILDGISYPAVTSVGTNPTFVHTEHPPVTVETFILDFDRDIYDKIVQVEFRRYLRGQVTYTSVAGLVEQIRMDVNQVRGYEQNVQAATGVFTGSATAES